MQIEVLRSSKRTKTIQARKVGDRIIISIPSSMTLAEEELYVTTMTRKIQQRCAKGIDLSKRANYLCAKYNLPIPNSIDWVDNQNTRWGSCSIATKKIRISSRLEEFPSWVLDYVLIHELTHLVVASHNSQFWRLVNRYPKAERSIGFLEAKSTS